MTLRWRLTLLYTALIALLLTGVFVAVYSQISSNIRQTLETDLNSNLDQVRRLIEASDVRYPTAEGWSSISQETFAEILQFVSEPNDIDVLSFTSRQPTRFKNVTLEQLDVNVELSDEDYSALLRNKEFSGRGFLSNEGQKAVEVRALTSINISQFSRLTIKSISDRL